MARTTEQDAIRAFGDLADRQESLYGGALGREDAQAIAMVALLVALRTYRQGQAQGFKDYARGVIGAVLRDAQLRQRASRRAEARLSLDMPVSFEDERLTYADLFAVYCPDETELEVKLFLHSLPSEERVPLVRALAGDDPGWDNRMLRTLQRKALDYGFGEGDYGRHYQLA